MPLELSTLAIVPAGVNLTVRGIQTTYELQSVPAETQALFKLIASTKSDILKARQKRIVLAKTCELDDLDEWDRSVSDTEAALLDLEKLLEPARLDIDHNEGKLRMKTKFLWVMRDSKSLSATSDRLLLAHQRMLSAQLMTRIECDQERARGRGQAPPPYASNEGIIKQAADKLGKGDDARKALANSLRIVGNGDVGRNPSSPAQTMAESTRSDSGRAFNSPQARKQHIRPRSQMRRVSMPAAIEEIQPEGISRPNIEAQRRMTVSVPFRTRRRLDPSASASEFKQTSALPSSVDQYQPRKDGCSKEASESTNPVLPPTPPRSPSPFQDEIETSPQEVVELEAIAVAPNRTHLTKSMTSLETQHKDLASKVAFRKDPRQKSPGFTTFYHRRPYPKPPYPVTNPPTPELRYAAPSTLPIASSRFQDHSPCSNGGRKQQHLKQRTFPTFTTGTPNSPVSLNVMTRTCPVVSTYSEPLPSSQSYCAPSSSELPPRPLNSILELEQTRTRRPFSHRPPRSEPLSQIDSNGNMASAASSAVASNNPSVNPSALKSTSHMFAGHKKPVDIRWKPEPESCNDEGGGRVRDRGSGKVVCPFSPDVVGLDQYVTREGGDISVRSGNTDIENQQHKHWVYVPYRPA